MWYFDPTHVTSDPKEIFRAAAAAMKAAMRRQPHEGPVEGSKGNSDNLDRMGNGGKPVVWGRSPRAGRWIVDQQMAEMEKSSELVKNLDSTSAQLDASDRASRERIESAAALLEKQAEMLRRKSMEQLDEQIRQYEAKVAKGERGDTPSKLASLKREMSVVQSSGKAVSSGFCRFLQCLP